MGRLAEPFFSIVMPAYNVERSLEEAASSVLAQTFSDFELLLVDDASPDRSGAICDALQGEDARVRAIHLAENGGLSRARNAGLDAARGRYVYFMDSDDVVDKTLLESAHASLERSPAQAVMFGMREEYYDENGRLRTVREVRYKDVLLRGGALRREIVLIEGGSLFGYACNKAYSRGLIEAHGLRFETVTLIEDVRFNAAFFARAESLNCLSTAPYHYKKRGGESLTAKFAPDYYALHMERVQLIKTMYVDWGMYDAKVKRALAAVYARFALSALARNCDRRAHMSFKARRNFVEELLSSELYRELMPHARPKGGYARLASAVLASKNAAAILILGRAVNAVNARLPFLFAKAKQSR
ncbi:MAG: glycosyltransferase family 2 protein [Clostridiaceae bacterium]|nr:glycosyltransferase [Eubacteriales bacterium]